MILVQEIPDDGSTTDFCWSEEDSTETQTISIGAMGGFTELAHSTMRIVGKYKRRSIHVLIDSGSTHNFLDVTVTKSLGCPLKLIESIYVTVANRQEMICNRICEQFR